ncbi:hypothetical protein RJ639_024167 [Escallonia herrerae]|uniref:KIB1-4 beta-propeller domain-containing protein n=1 Tax=Escallonia herrerae TaxID=1293975 RepID=A0AA88UZK4_9ASTE|nr:hypothetical protein RJ639_024167 [Escallonia herrerae]
MSNWSDLQADLLRLIARRLASTLDRASFSAVCKDWSSLAASEPNFVPSPPPWLILVEKSNSTDSGCRVQIGLSAFAFGQPEEVTLELCCAEARSSRCIGSTGSWLVMADSDNTRSIMHLINPFSLQHIELPGVWPLRKMVLSHSTSNKQDFIAMATRRDNNVLYFASKSSESWTGLFKLPQRCLDIASCNGEFYVLDNTGVVLRCDMSSTPYKPVIMPVSDLLEALYTRHSRYLLECSGQLLQVITSPSGFRFGDEKFAIFRLDFTTGEWVGLTDLGSCSIFLGFHTSVAVLASKSSKFTPNCIYFIDMDNTVGVYNLKDRNIERDKLGDDEREVQLYIDAVDVATCYSTGPKWESS